MHGYQALKTQLEGAPNARRRAEIESLHAMTYQDVLRDNVIVGSPDTVYERLRALRGELGIDGILAELNFGARILPALMMRSLRLLCEEVGPRLRTAPAPPLSSSG